MDKRAKKTWVKALRSGKYKQGQGALMRFNGNEKPEYCCLGVLCKVLKRVAMEDSVAFYAGDCSNADLPGTLGEDLGIGGNTESRLINFNDAPKGKGHKSFKGIATWIEKHL